MNRRSLLIGLGTALAAPAIVKAESLMKIAVVRQQAPVLTDWTLTEYAMLYQSREMVTPSKLRIPATMVTAAENLLVGDLVTLGNDGKVRRVRASYDFIEMPIGVITGVPA